MKKDEFWALWDVIWIRNELVMAERKFGNKGFARKTKLQFREFLNLNL